jgi:predicted ABC-type transport system involved in lysophospholipase L1 biosynthesis ATPase subunit
LPVLTDVSLEVFAGESVSIRGSSGSGKTTLLQQLGGLDEPDAGVVRILAADVGLVAPRTSLGRGVGFVFQNYQLMPELTALENVALAARIAGMPALSATAAARALLTQVGLGARLEHLPAKLSGGECQRVAIARALVNRPSVILADEPTGNLDERTGVEIMDLLLGVVAERGAALVLVTHSREFAERAGRRLVLSGGVLSPA